MGCYNRALSCHFFAVPAQGYFRPECPVMKPCRKRNSIVKEDARATRVRICRHCIPVGISDMHRLHHLHLNAFPQSGTDKSRHNVPYVCMGSSTDEDRFNLREVYAENRGNILPAFQHRRSDINLQDIGLSCRIQCTGGVETVRNQHIIRTADVFPVDIYFRKTVNAAEIEHHPVSRVMNRRSEQTAISPLVSFDTSEKIHIAAGFRLRHQPGGTEIKLYITGNGSLN